MDKQKHAEFIGGGYASFTKGSSFLFTTDAVTNRSSTASGKTQDTDAKDSPNLIDPDRSTYRQYVTWFDDNQYPHQLLEKIGRLGIGKRSLNTNADMHYGSGIIWVREEYTENGKIRKVPVLVNDWRRMCRMHKAEMELSDAIEALEYFGIAFVQLIFNKGMTRVNRFKTLKTAYCRFTPMDNKGRFKSILYSAAFPDDPKQGEFSELPLYDSDEPFKHPNPIVVLTYGDQAKLYYPKPDYSAVFENGWSDIAESVPKQIASIYKNAINIKWHIKIPVAFFRVKYKEWDEKPESEQIKLIETERDDMEKWLVGSENAHKAFVSMIESGEDAHKSEGWVFEPMKNYLDSAKELPNAIAANSEILYAMSLDPEQIGLGIPGSSNLSGSGSGKRNANDIKQSTLSRERLVSRDLLNTISIINGYPEDVIPVYLSQDTSQTMDENPTGSQTVIR